MVVPTTPMLFRRLLGHPLHRLYNQRYMHSQTYNNHAYLRQHTCQTCAARLQSLRSIVCLFVDKVDTKSVKTMKKEKNLLRSSLNRIRLEEEVYDLYRVQNLPISVVMEKTGLSRSSIYNYLRIFEASNPEMSEQMKKRKDVTPADYKKLQDENARLQSELKREKLRADFYEEMVAFGKEVYGIDLKKAGTK